MCLSNAFKLGAGTLLTGALVTWSPFSGELVELLTLWLEKVGDGGGGDRGNGGSGGGGCDGSGGG